MSLAHIYIHGQDVDHVIDSFAATGRYKLKPESTSIFIAAGFNREKVNRFMMYWKVSCSAMDFRLCLMRMCLC